MPKWFRPLLACACFSILVLAGQIAAVRPQKLAAINHPIREGRPQDSGRLEITVSSLGPSQSLIDATTARLPEQDTLRSYLQGARYRLIAFELLPGKAEDLRPDSFRALYYDYTNNRTVRAEGSFESISNLEVTVGSDQPVPSAEEYEAAVAILMKDPKLGSSLTQNRLKANPAMPPVIYSDEAAAPVERTINILLLPTAKSEMETEVVGVNMVRNTVVRFPGGAPPTSRANPTACGIPSAGQATTSNGTLGQFQFVVTKNGMEVWRFTAIRPSASSGAVGERSGIDLVNVKFKGKMLLRRMHAPILNVNYDGNVCGPYRDWQWQEGMFQADGTDVPGTNGGVRDCADRPATTALDTDNDFGNFRGIAFYTVGADSLSW